MFWRNITFLILSKYFLLFLLSSEGSNWTKSTCPFLVREGWLRQIGKVPKGGGSFSIQKFCNYLLDKSLISQGYHHQGGPGGPCGPSSGQGPGGQGGQGSQIWSGRSGWSGWYFSVILKRWSRNQSGLRYVKFPRLVGWDGWGLGTSAKGTKSRTCFLYNSDIKGIFHFHFSDKIHIKRNFFEKRNKMA